MSLKLSTRQADDYIVIEASGQIQAGEACLQFQEFAKPLLEKTGRVLLLLDLKSVSYIDSAGLGVLLSIYATVRIQGGDLKLLNVSHPVKEALTITNLLQIFEILSDPAI
jgi:anti-sigma B factor antagonist